MAVLGATITGYGIYKATVSGEIVKYSRKWFKNMSSEQLNAERELVRQQFCSAGDDFYQAGYLQKLLRLFDSVLNEREWNGNVDYKYPAHSEHGWYLSSDD